MLLDVRRIAPCLPGARLVEVLGPNRYSGEVAVRLGPVAVKFAGRVEIVETDATSHEARMVAQGTDTKGRGGAAAEVRFALIPQGDGTQVSIVTDLILSGSVAQYGRASGMISDVANHIIQQFSANLHRLLAQDRAGAASATSAGELGPASQREATDVAALQAGSLGLILLWRAIRRFCLRLFGRSE